MTTLRQMQKEDLQEVNLLLSKAFTHARIQQGYREGRVPLCRKEFLELYFTANSSGCFVIEKNHRIISFCFTRLWGTVSWLGPLGVDPSEEGQGFGKEIVMAAVRSLKTSGAKTIGLELAANSARNLAFYTKLGFEPRGLVIDVIKKVSGERQPLKVTEFEKIM
ncbi:GNAT family N-acetyltransferase, partial [candidate division KSB1 bacterium]|nr:GNAT family N-acetyltransferase [candidate division KSB1 bacterium]